MLYELFWPSHGGIENWLYFVGKELARRGHVVDLITCGLAGSPKEEPLATRFRVLRIDPWGVMQKRYVSGHVNIARQIFWIPISAMWLWRNAAAYDVVHAHLQASLTGAALSVGSQRLFWSWHGTYRKQLYGMYSWWRAVFYDLAERIAVRIPCAACITADAYTAKLARNELRGIRTRMIPVPNGVDTTLFCPAPVEKPAEWGSGFHLLVPRRLVYKNGVQFLLRAVPEIVAQRPDFKVVVYGDGPMRPELCRFVDEHGLEANVRFFEPVPSAVLARLYNAADAVAVPSLIEATSLSVLEAMACAKPLLTCPVGGVPEVAPSDCVIYAEPGDVDSLKRALRRMLFEMTPDDLKRMGKRASAHVSRNFTWKHTASHLEKIYQQVLNGNRSGR